MSGNEQSDLTKTAGEDQDRVRKEALAKELKDGMGFKPNRWSKNPPLRGIPPFKVQRWKTLPSFAVVYHTKITNGDDPTVYDVDVVIQKTKDSEFADVLFNGSKFGELHVGKYKAGEEIRHGPNFVPKIDAKTRKEVFGGHISPWTTIMPANVFTKNAFNRIMEHQFPEGIESHQLEFEDSNIIKIPVK